MSKNTLKVFKALANRTRIKILKKLVDDEELSCQELMKHFPLSQPTLSHHFGKLIEGGILRVKKDGVSHYYSVNKTYLAGLGVDIEKITKL
ncbi:TPA: ArsR family transcriptional regulator [candidate division WWE3 bacterium]|uniref:ArsR family transcriptional regulator n=1 Tax=candidate division WWE3 bacterium TaxID=2053526 RepID=A0A656PLK3_UNCKA|nr:Arsenical resistance operon repressor [candidate division WWE3 bacterium RAAC2_WWE3_1]KKS29874.1 MAG: Arsenical resistance operon repressor [candidate division WWE3 bacterium GW2011_GWB1_42_117]KKS55299.1 MAG: Arsenical resistance operon repressor [candidate division WWE3 bacterium GW2011_GWD2_42_34]KKT05852.1 MAG: Arsenical resistance operon repressor [candidate division WWE3 bacterium GW2011_GWE2_43_18]KKT07258.1 MAG: Arsenical resistance operon repressor [candidate division WWE3 bacterium